MKDQREALRADYATIQRVIRVERGRRVRFLSGEDRDLKVAECDRALLALGRLGAALAAVLGPGAAPAIDQPSLFDGEVTEAASTAPAVQ